jgi:ABC-type ATPase with predicted acetyltransferase domain
MNSTLSVTITASVHRDVPHAGSAGEIARRFGLTTDHHETLYDHFSLTIQPHQLLVVTGPSGSGKSRLLAEVASQTRAISVKCLGRYWSDRPVIDAVVGATAADQLHWLGYVGLAEASILTARVGQLSEGQRTRLSLARAVSQAARRGDSTCLLIDEFAATLDGLTATVLARQLRAIVTKQPLSVVLATHRVELLPALQPDGVLVKPIAQPACWLTREELPRYPRCANPVGWPIKRGRIGDYRQLQKYHYIAGPPAAHKRVWTLRTPLRYRKWGAPEIAAVLVVSPPVPCVRGRNVATAGRYVLRNRTDALARVNAELECISRVIVHPMFRGLGLASRLVRHALATAETPRIETLAAMGKIHPLFTQSGMQLVGLFKGPRQYYRYYLGRRG